MEALGILLAMRAFVFTGGEAPAAARVLPELIAGDLLVAADSGLLTIKAFGLEPDLIIGDMDSLPDQAMLEGYPRERVKRHGRNKDESDTELAYGAALEAGADEISIVGGGGGRLDHLLGILCLFERVKGPAAWYLPQGKAWRVEGREVFSSAPGEPISFFPLGSTPLRMESEGLRWPLSGLEFARGFMSLSNEASGESVSLKVISGKALAMRGYRDAE
jgi:thiamine pyrophosphokinase